MTAPTTTAGRATRTDTSASRGPRELVRSARLPVLLLAGLLALAALTVLTSDRGVGLLDVDSYSDEGSHAVATLLRDRGVPVDQVRTLDEASSTSGGTLAVVGSELLAPEDAERLALGGATTIVVFGASDPAVVGALAPDATVVRTADPGEREPACSWPGATAAGRADAGGVLYAPTPDTTAVGCYPVGGEASVLRVGVGSRTVVLVGNPAILQNAHLADEGNAALALNLLGEDGPVTWYLPSLTDLFGDDAGGGASPLDLVPDGALGALAWTGVVIVLLALWRARRFGPVVDEPLPVVVRASETDEGRARLYRRGASRDRAAQLLRSAAIDRLTPRVGARDRAGLIAAVAERTGRAPTEIGALLYGAAPRDDRDLVVLANALDRLEREVQRA